MHHYYSANNTTAAVYIGGVVGSEALVWGAQFEQNDSPTNYVATYGTPVPKPTYSVPKSISGYTGTPLNQAHSSSLSTYENITYDQNDGAFVFNGVDSSSIGLKIILIHFDYCWFCFGSMD